MKRTFRILAAGLAASLALVSCDKESLTKTDNGATKDGVRTITVSFADVTRSELNGLQPSFKVGDKIKVSDGATVKECEVAINDGVATITTDLTGELSAVYPASASTDGKTFSVSSTAQDGSFAMANICTATIPDGANPKAEFENQTAILKFSVPAKADGKGVDYSPKTIKIKSRGSQDIATGKKEITITGKDGDAIATSDGGFYYMAVLPGETISNLTICSGDGMRCPTASGTLAANTIYDVALPVLNGHEYVELKLTVGGLPKILKWATMNVDATTSEEYGGHYQWGGLTPDPKGGRPFPDGYMPYAFNWGKAPFNNGNSSFDSEYFDSVKDNACPDGVLAYVNDAAKVYWGGSWRMPTIEELSGLVALSKKEWKASSPRGYTFKDVNDNSIFLRDAGRGWGTDNYLGDGFYWSSSLDIDTPSNAFYLGFDGSSISASNSDERCHGMPIRPVSE